MNRLIIATLTLSGVTLLSACGSSVSEFTRQQVARSESVVQSAQTTVGQSEVGAIELQRAKDTQQQAQAALNKKDEKRAQRLASQAQLDAELAIAKAQNASARKAADDVLASVRTLRQETERVGTSPR
jgi:hypothetical protein